MKKYLYHRYFDIELKQKDICYITVNFITNKIELHEKEKGYKNYQIKNRDHILM